MSGDLSTPRRDAAPTNAFASSLPPKRAFDDDLHAPAVSSPLNPDFRPSKKEQPQASREESTSNMPGRTGLGRPKKDGKKREAKGAQAAHGLGDDSSRVSPDPNEKPVPPSEASPSRYKVPPPKPSDFEPPRPPQLSYQDQIEDPDGQTIEFCDNSEQPHKKKYYSYAQCIADPQFPASQYYRQTECEPCGPRLSFTDMASHILIDQSGRSVTTEKGFRTARGNVAVREGRWYWECKVLQGVVRGGTGKGKGEVTHGHVRMGWARREASLDAPVGFDAYSYGIRDVTGQKVHLARPHDFFPRLRPGGDSNGAGEEDIENFSDICEGDVVGLEIQLPTEQLHRKVVEGRYNPAVDMVDEDELELTPTAEAANVVRDRIPIRVKAHVYFEKIDYHPTKELEELMNPSAAAAAAAAAVAGAGTGAQPNNASTPTKAPAALPPGSNAPVGAANNTSSKPSKAALAEAPHPNHPLPAMRTLPGSRIRVFRNGVLIGTAFEGLLAFLPPASRPSQAVPGARVGFDDGMLGYYPAISVFRGGAAQVNFGPDFWFPPPGYEKPRAVSAAAGAGGEKAKMADSELMQVDAESPSMIPADGTIAPSAMLLADDDDAELGQGDEDDNDADEDGDVAMGGMGGTGRGTARRRGGRGRGGGRSGKARGRTVQEADGPPTRDDDPDGTGLPSRLVRIRAIAERFEEQVVEDVVWDIVDEVDFWVQDERRREAEDAAAAAKATATAAATVATAGPADVPENDGGNAIAGGAAPSGALKPPDGAGSAESQLGEMAVDVVDRPSGSDVVGGDLEASGNAA